jgi:hypothetical protein
MLGPNVLRIKAELVERNLTVALEMIDPKSRIESISEFSLPQFGGGPGWGK